MLFFSDMMYVVDQFNCGGSFAYPLLYTFYFLAKFLNSNMSLACRREKKKFPLKKVYTCLTCFAFGIVYFEDKHKC